MNVPLTMKSLFFTVISDKPYDKTKAVIISINPVIPASTFKRLPNMNDKR